MNLIQSVLWVGSHFLVQQSFQGTHHLWSIVIAVVKGVFFLLSFCSLLWIMIMNEHEYWWILFTVHVWADIAYIYLLFPLGRSYCIVLYILVYLRVKQAQPKMFHSPKVENGVEIYLFLLWSIFLEKKFNCHTS